MIHAADITKSHRLRQYLDIMADGQWHSTRALQEKTGSMCTHTDIAELRANHQPVSSAKYLGKTETGARVFGYRLEK